MYFFKIFVLLERFDGVLRSFGAFRFTDGLLKYFGQSATKNVLLKTQVTFTFILVLGKIRGRAQKRGGNTKNNYSIIPKRKFNIKNNLETIFTD